MELKSPDIEKKLKRKDFLEEIKKASNEEYITEWDTEGKIGVQKKKSNVKRGAVSKSAGNAFETVVRKNLNEKDWIVDKWSNNLDLSQRDDPAGPDKNLIHPCKRTFKRFGVGKGVMTIGTGFPDFIAFQRRENGDYKIIGVEVKMNGKLARIEKEKCSWYLKNKIFSEILVASKIKEKNRVRVEYVDFLEIQKRMR